MTSFHPDCRPILIGSFPVADHHEAAALVMTATPQIPVWAQLPVHPAEGMVPQFAPGMPGLRQMDDHQFVDLGGDDFETELAAFYEDYLAVAEGSAPLPGSRFALGKQMAGGFYTLQEKITGTTPTAIKGQVTGPITFGLGLKDQQGRAIFYDPNVRDAAVKLLSMKAVYQIKTFEATACPVIVFLDEPALAGYGSSEMISISADEIAASLDEINHAIHSAGGLAGIHVCANTDWGLILNTSVDIVNFDTYSYFDRFLLYGTQVRQFIARGGIIAWGLIPTGSAEALAAASVDSLVQLWDKQCDDLVALGVEREQLRTQSLISPSCGVGSLTLEQANKVLALVRDVSARIRDRG